MIYSKPGEEFVAQLDHALVGASIQVGIYLEPGATVVSAFSSLGVTEESEGGGYSTFYAVRTAPSAPAASGKKYVVVWTDGSTTRREELVVTSRIPIPAATPSSTTYATVADFETYMGPSWQTEDPSVVEDVIRKAQRDIDEYIGITPTKPSGLIYDPTELDVTLSNALRDATCGQVEYRLAMGEPFFTGITFGQEGPDVTPRKTPPRVSAYAKRTLIRSGLATVTGRFL